MNYPIFVIDDDPNIRSSILDLLSEEDFAVRAFPTVEDSLDSLQESPPYIILLDIDLPGMSGLEFLEILQKDYPDIEVIIITGHADVQSSVTAMKLGARDYLKKPFNPDELLLIIQKTLAVSSRENQLKYLQEEQWQEFRDLVGTSPPMKTVFEFIRQVAHSSRTSILIRGETGTGKELVARAIHQSSPRQKEPFVEVNCSAFQESLLESELFGYEAGAFTGARGRKRGLLELANKGTFFLDEIGDMSLELQAKLLKVIEEREFRRVGGTRHVEVDIRFISASSKDLDRLMAEGNFRHDLYYRINVASIELPPLRARGQDIILIAEHFVKRYSAEFKHKIHDLDPQVRDFLLNYNWPGNVRELRNAIERAVLFEKRGVLSIETLDFLDPKKNYQQPESVLPDVGFRSSDGLNLGQMERNFILRALNQTNGNKSQAARLLGITREKLKYRLKKYNIDQIPTQLNLPIKALDNNAR